MKKKIFIITFLFLLFTVVTQSEAFGITVTNGNDLVDAINRGETDIVIQNSVDVYKAISINHNITISPASQDNAIRCKVDVDNFITIASGKTLTLDSIVIDVRGAQNNAYMNCVRVPSGATYVSQGSLIDGGMTNTGLRVESGGKAYINRGDFVYSNKGIQVVGTGILDFTGEGTEIWNNNIGLSWEGSGTCVFDQGSTDVKNNTTGIQVSSGTVILQNANVYSNDTGVVVPGGTFNQTGGSIYSNNIHGVTVSAGTFNKSGGSIQNNASQGVVLQSGDNGMFKMTGGSISGNGSNAIHTSKNGDRCVIHGGTISGYVYLNGSDNYVTTNTSYPTFSVYPSSYTFKRKLVKTDSNAYAKNEISKVTLRANGSWYKYVDGQYIVLWTGGNVIVKYIDECTNEVLDTETKNGTIGTSVTLTDKTISGYALVTRPSTLTYTYAQADQNATYGYRKVSNLVVKHIDANSGAVLITDTIPLKEGDTYTTTAKSITGYQNVTGTDSKNIVMERADTEIVYNYKKISEGVDVKYIDQVTGEVLDEEHLDGLEADLYTTSEKQIEGYQLVKTPDNPTVNMTVTKITVTYEYRKNSNVIVKYLDENYGTPIINDVVSLYKQGDAYTTEQKSFDGYQFMNKSNNTSGTVERDDIIVTYNYKKISEGVETRFIDQVTKQEIADRVPQTGLEKDAYTTTAKEIEDYELVLTPDNATGEMEVAKTTVTYEYRNISYVTIKYIDENYGTEIVDADKIKYLEEDNYSTSAKNIDGYQLTKSPTNGSGVIARSDITVEYKYKKISEGVDTRYIDQVTGDEIATTEHQGGLEKDEYITTAKEISGYELVLTPDNSLGKMVVGKTTVTYEYRLVSDVVTKYIDMNTGNTIVPNEVASYKEGDEYSTEEKSLVGYQLVDKTLNIVGTMGREDIEVTYRYKKVAQGVEAIFVDQVTGNPISTSVIINGLENQSYETEAKEVEGYELVKTPNNATGKMSVNKIVVRYEYRKLSNIVAKYIDINYNSEITAAVTQTLKEGDLYETEQKVLIGYQLVNNPTNKKGTLERKNIEVVYEYKRISEGVETRFIDQATGTEIAPKVEQNGLEKDGYTTEPKVIKDYELVKIPTNKNGEMAVEKITVTYEYRLMSSVTTKHIDANTQKEIVDPVIVKYKQGEKYTTTAKDLAGYVLVKSPEAPNGEMGRESIVVVYEYKMISEGLVVKYIDEISSELLDMETYAGNENDVIQLEEKSFDKFILSKRPSVSEIKLIVEPQETRFYYKKLIDVTVKGIDAITGEELYSKVQTGVESMGYETKPVDIPGYVLVTVPDNANGAYTRDDTEIVYQYKRVSPGVTVRYIDKDINEVIDQATITGFVGEEYKTEKKEFEKYDFVTLEGTPAGKLTADKIEVTYYYAKKTGIVEVVYTDEEGNELLKEEMTGKVDEPFEIVPKTINNYKIKEIKGDLEGVFEIEKQIVQFEMEKIKGKVIVYLFDQDGKLLGQLDGEGYVGELYEVELPEKEGYYIDGDNKISIEYIDGEIIIKVTYVEIPKEEPPATGDINIALYSAILSASLFLIVRLVLKKAKN